VGHDRRIGILAAAFLAWMFAGLEISLFVLIHRQMSLELLGADTPEPTLTRWFAGYQAAFLLGAAAGGWLFGALGDRLGRARAMGLSVLCYSGFTFGCSFAGAAELMLALRFLACLGIGGVWPNAVALVAEAWPDASRPLLSGLLGAAANFGFVLLGAIAFAHPVTQAQWRWTLLVGTAPAVLGVVILSAVPESSRWLASRAAHAGASAAGSPLREVLRAPLLSRTLLGVTLGAIPVVGSAANANWLVPWTDHAAEQRARASSPEGPARKTAADPRSKATTQMTRSGGAIFGSLLGGALAGWLGRRLSYFLISLGAFAVSSYIFGRLDPLQPYFQAWAFVLGFVGITYFGWLPLFLPELFPTRVRATGTGISFNTGRVAAAAVILAVALIGPLQGDYARVGFWTGMVYAIGMGMIWLAPRRAADRLED
jgi:MFS family permease